MPKKPEPESEHALLAAIDGELQGLHRSATKTYGGRRYTFRTTDFNEGQWAAGALGGLSSDGRAIGTKAATLCTALVSIDDVPVSQLWAPDPGEVAVYREHGLSLEDAQTMSRRGKIAAWLANPKKHPSFVEILYAFWSKELDEPRREALKKLDPLHATTADGGSDASS